MRKITLKRKRLSGNHRSHAMNARKRKWFGNKQSGIVFINGKPVKVIGSMREIRSLRKKHTTLN